MPRVLRACRWQGCTHEARPSRIAVHESKSDSTGPNITYPIIVDNSELSVQSLSDILLGTDLKSNWTNEWKRFLPVNQKEFVFKDSGHAREKLVGDDESGFFQDFDPWPEKGTVFIGFCTIKKTLLHTHESENEVESEKASFLIKKQLFFKGFAKIKISPRLLGVGS